MIYLIREKFVNLDTGKLLDLLKIGYTDDNNFNDRMSQYRLHCPGFKLLLIINGCDDKIEKALHRYFREYLYNGYGREWFNYDERIIDFLKEYNTKDLLEEKLKHLINYTTLDNIELYKNIKKVVNRWLCLVSSDISSLQSNSKKIKQIISDCKGSINKYIFLNKDIITYLVKQYNISEDIEKDLLDYISGNINNSNKIHDFLLEFNIRDSFTEKMGFLCNYPLTEDELGIILDQVPLNYKKYYETLGPERLKALAYHITKVEKEYQATLFNKDDLKAQIYLKYQINNRYSRNSIKEDLQKLYDKLNYTKKAKANDLEEYFELKDCKVLNSETGKYDRGYELIKKKD